MCLALRWLPFLTCVALFCASGWYSFHLHLFEENACAMSYSRPQYVRLPVPVHNLSYLWREPSLTHYSLYRYVEAQIDRPLARNVVLFIHGNAGSYKQVRSLASRVASSSDRHDIDFYSVDLQEELAAVSGRTLWRQTEYVNLCIREIHAMHSAQPQPMTSPVFISVLGHSIGGVIARGVVKMRGPHTDAVAAIITLGSPHSSPAFTFTDPYMYFYYRLIHHCWQSRRNGSEHRAGVYESPGARDGNSVAFLSIGGGVRDNLVESHLTSLHTRNNEGSLLRYERLHGAEGTNAEATLLAASLPALFGHSVDHQCLLWCSQLVDALTAVVGQVFRNARARRDTASAAPASPTLSRGTTSSLSPTPSTTRESSPVPASTSTSALFMDALPASSLLRPLPWTHHPFRPFALHAADEMEVSSNPTMSMNSYTPEEARLSPPDSRGSVHGLLPLPLLAAHDRTYVQVISAAPLLFLRLCSDANCTDTRDVSDLVVPVFNINSEAAASHSLAHLQSSVCLNYSHLSFSLSPASSVRARAYDALVYLSVVEERTGAQRLAPPLPAFTARSILHSLWQRVREWPFDLADTAVLLPLDALFAVLSRLRAWCTALFSYEATLSASLSSATGWSYVDIEIPAGAVRWLELAFEATEENANVHSPSGTRPPLLYYWATLPPALPSSSSSTASADLSWYEDLAGMASLVSGDVQEPVLRQTTATTIKFVRLPYDRVVRLLIRAPPAGVYTKGGVGSTPTYPYSLRLQELFWLPFCHTLYHHFSYVPHIFYILLNFVLLWQLLHSFAHPGSWPSALASLRQLCQHHASLSVSLLSAVVLSCVFRAELAGLASEHRWQLAGSGVSAEVTPLPDADPPPQFLMLVIITVSSALGLIALELLVGALVAAVSLYTLIPRRALAFLWRHCRTPPGNPSASPTQTPQASSGHSAWLTPSCGRFMSSALPMLLLLLSLMVLVCSLASVALPVLLRLSLSPDLVSALSALSWPIHALVGGLGAYISPVGISLLSTYRYLRGMAWTGFTLTPAQVLV